MRRKPLRRQITAGVLAFILSIASLGAFRFGAFRAYGTAPDDAEITAAGVASGDVYYYDADGQRVYVESVSKAWEEAVSLGTGMGITADLRCGRLSLPKNRAVFVELNGRILSRGLAGAAPDGEIFFVDDDATLTVYGGTADNPACAMEQIHTVRAYEVDGKGELTEASKTVYGGVLTGGFSRRTSPVLTRYKTRRYQESGAIARTPGRERIFFWKRRKGRGFISFRRGEESNAGYLLNRNPAGVSLGAPFALTPIPFALWRR